MSYCNNLQYQIQFSSIFEEDLPYHVIYIDSEPIGWSDEEEIKRLYNQNDLIIEKPKDIRELALSIDFSKKEARQLKCFEHESEILIRIPSKFLNPFVKKEWKLKPDTEFSKKIMTKEEYEKIEHVLLSEDIKEIEKMEDGKYCLYGYFPTGLTKAVLTYTIQTDLIKKWWIQSGCKLVYKKSEYRYLKHFLFLYIFNLN